MGIRWSWIVAPLAITAVTAYSTSSPDNALGRVNFAFGAAMTGSIPSRGTDYLKAGNRWGDGIGL